MNLKRTVRLASIVVLIVLVMTVAGCGGWRVPSSGSLTGQVTDLQGTPLSGAIIRVGGRVAEADANGNFTLRGVTSGVRRIWITTEEHEPYVKTVTYSGATIALGQIKLAETPGTSFYAVQADGGSGSITLGDLAPTEEVAVVVAGRDADKGVLNYTYPTSNAVAISALPGYRVKGAARRLLASLPTPDSFNGFLRETEWEIRRTTPISPGRGAQFMAPRLMADRQVGTTDNFWVQVRDSDTPQNEDWDQITAELRLITASAYIYVDSNVFVDPSLIEELGDAFAKPGGIYETTRGYYGNEPSPGIDQDTHIFILITPLAPGIAGYFWGINEFTEEEASAYGLDKGYVLHSNEKEMLFIAPRSASLVNETKGTLAHEFEHMIFYNERENVEEPEAKPSTWLNEGFATMSEEVNGFGTSAPSMDLASQIEAYVGDTSSQSLTQWEDDPSNQLADYGAVYLFTRYLTDRFGRDKMKTIMRTPRPSAEAVGAAVGLAFDDLFTDWTMALILDHQRWASGNRFNFSDDFLHRSYGTVNLDGVYFWGTVPPETGYFLNKQYGVDFALVGGMSGAVTWSFDLDDPSVTDVLVIRRAH